MTPTFFKINFSQIKSESRRSSGGAREKCGSTQCTKKHGALDPRQSQISQIEIGSSTSSMSPFIYNQEFMRERLAGIVASVCLPLTFGEDPRIVFHRIPRTTPHNDVIKCYKKEKNNNN